MKRIQMIFLGLVLLLAACTATTTEPTAPEPALTVDDSAEMEMTVEEAPMPETAVEEATMPETAVNETAAKPQFIMFTASW